MISYFEKISSLLLYFSDFFLKNRPWHVHLFCIFKIMQSHAWLKEKPKDFPLGNSVLGNILKSKDRLINAMILVNLRGQKSVIRKKLYLYVPKLICSRYNIFWGLLWANACKQAYVNACIPYIMENLTEKSVRCRWTISLDTYIE